MVYVSNNNTMTFKEVQELIGKNNKNKPLKLLGGREKRRGRARRRGRRKGKEKGEGGEGE